MTWQTSDELTEAQTAANYLREQTGHQSWAVVLLGQNAYRCNRCGDTFEPNEQEVAHHYGRACLKRLGVPAYVPSEDAQPARHHSTAL